MALFDRRPAGESVTRTPTPQYGLLLVDDEIHNLDALAGLLGEDYRVHTAGNGQTALALLSDPDIGPDIQIVVSDQRMPGMTGVQLLTRVRARRPDIKSLLLTGYNDVEAIVGAINDAAIYRYMQKPVDIPELRLALQRASEVWQLEQDNKDLMAALSQSYDQLAMLDAAKTSFLRYLAHEINTPLNWLAASTVIDRVTLGAETARMLEYVDLGRERLCGLVAAVLRYFEGAQLDLPVRIQPFNLAAVLGDHAELVRRQQAGEFVLRLEQPPELMVETDRELCMEILGHLLENAVTHAVRGGGNPEVVVRAHAADEGVFVEVHNSGAVPDAAAIETLFEPFFSCGSLHGQHGYGLSLATARTLALTAGGWLDADTATASGSGLRLRLWLPLRPPTGARAMQAGAAQQGVPAA